MGQATPEYPPGTVRSLIESDLLTEATRVALRARLQAPAVAIPRFFEAGAFATLGAVCDRLIPQAGRRRRIDLAGGIDTRLADGAGKGWRYADMPPSADMHRSGLRGIDQAAAALHDRPFVRLAASEQDALLRAVQAGEARGSAWAAMDARRYFEDLLAEAADIYYAHPLASEEIGYAGMADAHGRQAVGLDEREAHEPVAAREKRGAA